MPFGVHIDLITSMANLEGGGFAPQVPPAPRCTPVVISTKLTSARLSLALCCAGQPSFAHIQAAPRRALLSLDSIRRRSSQAKITDLPQFDQPVCHKAFKSTIETRDYSSASASWPAQGRLELLAAPNEVTRGNI
jgi:hypothetical protein